MNHGRWGRKWRALVRTKGSKVVEGEWVVGHLGTPMGFLNAQDTLLGRIASDHLLALPAWVRCLCWPPWAHMVPFSLLAVPCSCSLQAVAAAAQAGLLRQQEELDRKAAELERKERELQNTAANLHGNRLSGSSLLYLAQGVLLITFMGDLAMLLILEACWFGELSLVTICVTPAHWGRGRRITPHSRPATAII